MTAKEMFEKLGYENYIQYPNKIVYRNKYTTKDGVYISSINQEHNNGALPREIIFWNEEYAGCKTIDFKYGRLGSYLYFELLQVINKQVEELGWLDKKDNANVFGSEAVLNELEKWLIDYRFKKTGSHEDGEYCVAISVTDMLNKIQELKTTSED